MLVGEIIISLSPVFDTLLEKDKIDSPGQDTSLWMTSRVTQGQNPWGVMHGSILATVPISNDAIIIFHRDIPA